MKKTERGGGKNSHSRGSRYEDRSNKTAYESRSGKAGYDRRGSKGGFNSNAGRGNDRFEGRGNKFENRNDRFEGRGNKFENRNDRFEGRSGDSFESFDADNKNIIIGRNPVMEALKAGREVDKLLVAKGAEGSIIKIVGMAKDKGIPIIYTEKAGLDRVAGGGTHQGVAAYVSSYDYVEVEDILAAAKAKGEDPFIVILDNLEDPHNLGAIMRTCEAAGAHGIIIPKRRATGITETVAKASAGAVEYMPVAKVVNIAQTIEKLKEEGIWAVACDMGESMYYEQNLTGPIALVIGAEGEGISRLVREKCDFIASIPMKGHITSLNASSAAAVLIYEICRQRIAAGGK